MSDITIDTIDDAVETATDGLSADVTTEGVTPADVTPATEPEAGGLTPYLDPLRIPRTLRPGREPVRVDVRATWVRLHSQMAPTRVWAYDGQIPGPTFDVRRGQRIRVEWTNQIKPGSPYPVVAGEVPLGGPASPTAPGRGEGFEEVKEVAALPAWTVTHLHGAATGGGNDGWPENAVGYKDAQLSEYPNDQQATALWYHDHAMDITRWNVYSGLAGAYLIRDEEEDALHLPGGRYEIPLIVTDRNFETDEQGRPSGQLLHKVGRVPQPDPETGKFVSIPFTGPYTLVNGVVWPHLDVEPHWYRFRLLNASNARIYDLVLVDENDRPVPGAVKQIGSDGGLLPQPVPVDFAAGTPQERLTIAPAERMDLLVDFRALRGRRLRLVNRASQNVPFPQVMEFRVGDRPVTDRFVLPGVISSSFVRLTHDTPHGHRLVLLTPPGTKGGGGHPEIWEMEEVTDGSARPGTDGVVQIAKDGTTKTYRRTARTWDEGGGFMVEHGDYEQWSFLNLGGPTHPMHIHLAEFQILSRDGYATAGFDPAQATTPDGENPVRYTGGAEPAPNEQGWKDVFRVPAGQMVNVLGRYAGAYGRFVYHCHLLEHEDAGMMRSFTVMPPEVMVFHHHAGSGHGEHGEHDG